MSAIFTSISQEDTGNEKDVQNLRDLMFFSLPVYSCEIEVKIADTEEFQKTLKRKLEGRSGVAA